MLQQRFSILCISALLSLSTNGLYASKEGILTLDTFSMQSSGIGSSGPVAINGSQANRGM